MHRFSMSLAGNSKTNIPTTRTDASSCPPECPLMRNGCYASLGREAGPWKRISQGGGIAFSALLRAIRSLKPGTLWRHNSAGDLPGKGSEIDQSMLEKLVIANTGRRGFTFTHKPMLGRGKVARANRAAVKMANAKGFVINLSANNPAEADRLAALKVGPVACIVPAGTQQVSKTPGGRAITICPAQTTGATCRSCGLCYQQKRKAIVGFLPHGKLAWKVENIAIRS